MIAPRSRQNDVPDAAIIRAGRQSGTDFTCSWRLEMTPLVHARRVSRPAAPANEPAARAPLRSWRSGISPLGRLTSVRQGIGPELNVHGARPRVLTGLH